MFQKSVLGMQIYVYVWKWLSPWLAITLKQQDYTFLQKLQKHIVYYY